VNDTVKKTALLMLGATAPGEVVAARNALLRLAKTRQWDIHKLADAFNRALAVPEARQTNGHANGRANERARQREEENEEEISPQEMAAYCAEWDERRHGLTDKERDFVHDMMDWRYPTEKQRAWLTKIYQRAKRFG
jgi:hypothetical protein